MGLLNTLQTDPQAGIILIIALVFSLSFHEFAHAYVAYRLGDNTAAYQGRLTLNPLAHLDPIGSLMLLLVGFGYAKPVPVNPMNLGNPRTDMMKVAFAGPLSNLILCILGCLVIRFIGVHQLTQSLGSMLLTFSIINMILAVFNMIPVHPLDGGQIFGGYLDKINPELSYKLRIYGPNILFAIIFIGLFTGTSLLGFIFNPFIKLVILMAGLG